MLSTWKSRFEKVMVLSLNIRNDPHITLKLKKHQSLMDPGLMILDPDKFGVDELPKSHSPFFFESAVFFLAPNEAFHNQRISYYKCKYKCTYTYAADPVVLVKSSIAASRAPMLIGIARINSS